MPAMSTVGALPLWFFGRRLLIWTSWFYALVTGVSVGFMISVLEKKGFVVLAGSVVASQLIIMTAAFVLLSGYLSLFAARADRPGGEEKKGKG